jgi:Domain of unknown function (DUF4260)
MADTVQGISAPGVTGGPKLLLRLEGATLFLGAIVAFSMTEQPWWLFALLILVPDLSMAGYLAGSRVGALVYNAVHVTLGPIILTVVGLLLSDLPVLGVAMIWLAHIGIDRALGYGLKYGNGFGFTHLGRIGRNAT